MCINIIFAVIGILALIESILIILFPKSLKKIMLQISKKNFPLVKIGIFELVIALILIVASLL